MCLFPHLKTEKYIFRNVVLSSYLHLLTTDKVLNKLQILFR
jgi:hypothetical protein